MLIMRLVVMMMMTARAMARMIVIPMVRAVTWSLASCW